MPGQRPGVHRLHACGGTGGTLTEGWAPVSALSRAEPHLATSPLNGSWFDGLGIWVGGQGSDQAAGWTVPRGLACMAATWSVASSVALVREGQQRETGRHRLGPPDQTLTTCSCGVRRPGGDRGAAVPAQSFPKFAAPEPNPGLSRRRHRETVPGSSGEAGVGSASAGCPGSGQGGSEW